MSIKNTLRAALICCPLGLVAFNAYAESWHFVVKNKTDSAIVKLQVSQDKHTWGWFDIGSKGIAPGQRVTLEWASDTDDEKCHQWIRAKFADGSWSEATKQDFCHDLDDPIEFSE
jgi:hypothetical protein